MDCIIPSKLNNYPKMDDVFTLYFKPDCLSRHIIWLINMQYHNEMKIYYRHLFHKCADSIKMIYYLAFSHC